MKRLFLFLGIVLLGGVVWYIGFQEILSNLSRIGWSFFPLLCISFLWKINNTLAWTYAFPPHQKLPGFWRLFSVALAGDVVNNTLPTANIGGELAKPYLLKKYIPLPITFASVVANKTVEILSGLLFTCLGVVVALFSLSLSIYVRVGLLVSVSVGTLIILFLWLSQKNQAFSRLSLLLQRFSFGKRMVSFQQKTVEKIDKDLLEFYETDHLRFFICFILHFGSWLLGTLESYAVLKGMGVEVSLFVVFLLASLAQIITMAFFFVPGNLGTAEAGNTTLFLLLHLDPADGLSLALLKRFRKWFWVGVGVVLLYCHTHFDSETCETPQQPIPVD